MGQRPPPAHASCMQGLPPQACQPRQHRPHRRSQLQPLKVSLLLVISLSCSRLLGVGAVKVIVPPGNTECVLERVESEHFEVPGGPRIDGRVMVSGRSQYYVPFISIRLDSPYGDQLWQQQHVYSEAHFNVPAHGPGSYKVCFNNPWESRTDAIVELVYFTLAHLRQGTGNVNIPKGTAANRDKELVHKDHMDGMKRTILGMSEFVTVIKGSQKYLTRKLERHEETMASNRNRTVMYTGLEVLAVVAISLAQAYTIKKFFESGRIKISV